MPDDSSASAYARPPIVEAVMELRFPEASAQRVRKAADVLRSRYDNREQEQMVEGTLDFATRGAVFKETSETFKLTSSDQTNALQLTPTNAVWIRLAPYEGWHKFFARISEEMPKVLKAIDPPKLLRIGLRYVNRLDFPMEGGLGYHEHYLKFRIDTGEFLEPTNGFQWALRKDFFDRNLGANVQSATVAPELPRHGAILFDIDVFADVDVPSKIDDILDRLGHMHQLKNEIFEAGITDRARELFNARES